MSETSPSYVELRAARRLTALRQLLDWPGGMPPLPGVADLGTLRALAALGLARMTGVDRLGERRFELTDEGRAAIDRGAL